jgi:nickel transport protein
MRSTLLPPLALLLTLGLAPTASAHEMLSSVERGRAVAVKIYESDGDLVTDGVYEVFSPGAPEVAFQKGRTDRGGYLSFVPDRPGAWRVKVLGPEGHGLELTLPVDDSAGTTAGAGTASGCPTPTAFALRPLVGVLVIAAIFASLFAVYRRGRRTP